MKCHYEGIGCWEGRCMGTREVDPCVGYERCKIFKPDIKTNADCVRAMSDEELAKWMSRGALHSDSVCSYCDRNALELCDGVECRNKTDAEIILEWLKQPVKDGNGE